MAKLTGIAVVDRVFALALLLGLTLLASQAQAAYDRVTTYRDANGWKLQVNGEDFFIKGFVWGYTPRGATYSYNLWEQPDEFIQAVLDHDFGLMAKAGVTANRSFTIIPPKWVTYLYEKYGIMSVINPLMGRYGANIDGTYIQFTDYSDERTREVLKAEVLELVRQYKDVSGVLMFALGNESNYGLSWSSFEIEDLPVGEQNREKAKSLYSLFGETIRDGKRIAPDHLFTIVNGDVQYLDLIAEYAPEMDVLGINAYRGVSFEDPQAGVSLWADVKRGFDRPVVLMEFGSDAFNARDFAEDQVAQAYYLRSQWQEIYDKSYGNGQQGNAVGGFVFEWRDEWWKHKQTENLDKHDRTASWSNGGYRFDFVEGQNNMNEEWFGVARLGEIRDDGVYAAEPRMAYDVLKKIWQLDPYQSSRAALDTTIGQIDMDEMELKSDIRQIKAEKRQSDKFRLAGGSFTGEFLVNAFDSELDQYGEDGLNFSDGQMAFLDFEFQPSKQIKGDFTINVLANVLDSAFEFRYGDRGLPFSVVELDDSGSGTVVLSERSINDNERVEIYDFQASYEADGFDLLTFYHVPRYHWRYEGDYFGLLRETTDMEGEDIWNAKAPYGFEYDGKQGLEGLKIVAGPEIYWGANPRAMVKYQFGENDDYAVVFAEDIARREDTASATEATSPQSRELTLYARYRPWSGAKLEVGGIMANTQKVDDVYDRVEGGDIIVDQIRFEDTLGFKSTLTLGLGSGSEGYLGVHYAGLVADGGEPHREWGTELPYSELGNKQVVEGGIRFSTGDYTIYPRLFYRENIVDANPFVPPATSGTTLSPGIAPRNRDDDPFAVLDNREAAAAEVIFTYDPTPATYFYDWNSDMFEDAPFAFNLGLTATDYRTAADAELFFDPITGSNVSFGAGLEAAKVWLLQSRVVFNPRRGLKVIGKLYTGQKQSTGLPDGKIEYYSVEGKLVVDSTHIYEGYIRIDDFGPYDFYDQFNLTYPLQVKLEYARLLDALRDEDRSSKIGVKLFYRELDENSPEDEYQGGANQYMMEVQTYITLSF